jgi:hypothetical protein
MPTGRRRWNIGTSTKMLKDSNIARAESDRKSRYLNATSTEMLAQMLIVSRVFRR